MSQQATTAKRDGFSSRFGLIAAAAGSAVGLGNIWKFPYIVGENGGSAFILVYFHLIINMVLRKRLCNMSDLDFHLLTFSFVLYIMVLTLLFFNLDAPYITGGSLSFIKQSQTLQKRRFL